MNTKADNATKTTKALNELTLDELQSLPTQTLFKFAALCAHWADLAESELGKRAQRPANTTYRGEKHDRSSRKP